MTPEDRQLIAGVLEDTAEEIRDIPAYDAGTWQGTDPDRLDRLADEIRLADGDGRDDLARAVVDALHQRVDAGEGLTREDVDAGLVDDYALWETHLGPLLDRVQAEITGRRGAAQGAVYLVALEETRHARFTYRVTLEETDDTGDPEPAIFRALAAGRFVTVATDTLSLSTHRVSAQPASEPHAG